MRPRKTARTISSRASDLTTSRLFDLELDGDIAIPFTPKRSRTGAPDVFLRASPPPSEVLGLPFLPWEASNVAEFHSVARAGEVWRLSYVDGTIIHVTRDAVWMTWQPPLTLEDACTYLVGAPFALLLRMRGIAAIHASAVRFGTNTAAFAGPSGAGKSTAVVSLLEKGAELVSDDLLAIDLRDGIPFVLPAYAGVRLWPDNAAIDRAASLPPISPSWDKRIYAARLLAAPSPLDCMYVLGEHPSTLRQADAIVSLVANSYRPDLMLPEWRRREFEILSRVVDSVPVLGMRPGSPSHEISNLAQACATGVRERRHV